MSIDEIATLQYKDNDFDDFVNLSDINILETTSDLPWRRTPTLPRP